MLHGEGGVFCAGADLKAIGTPAGNRRRPATATVRWGRRGCGCRKPVIAAIAGHAVAGGLELALWCDLRVAEQGAVLGVFCRRWGVPLIDGGTVRLPRLIGVSRAMDLILTGRPVGAAEALAIGLVNRVVGPGESLAAAQELARSWRAFRRPACARTGCRCSSRRGSPRPTRWPTSSSTGCGRWPRSQPGLERFRAGAGRHGTFD